MPTVPPAVLAATVALPVHPVVCAARLTPANPVLPTDALEHARRAVLTASGSAPLPAALLPVVQPGPPPGLVVFRICARDDAAEAIATLSALGLEGMTAANVSSFALDDLFPCSSTCADSPIPCPRCPQARSPPSPASLFPRRPLRALYALFIDAVRIRLLNDIATAALGHPTQRTIQRLNNGFLLGVRPSPTKWADSCAYRTLGKPLLYCELQILLGRTSPPSLILHPHLLQTHYLPLTYNWPLPPGTSIALLPYEVPAYYLTHYAGPTSAIARQFCDSLRGLGLSGWDAPLQPTLEPTSQPPQFIIAWISVENTQGEDKGVAIIYPASLCLSFAPSAPSRSPLQFMPQLPLPLQPSPPSATATSPSRVGSPLSAATPLSLSVPAPAHPQFIVPSPSSPAYLRAFRALTLLKSKDLTSTSAEVAAYVDAVARERERERERLKRERAVPSSTTGPSGSTGSAAAPTQTPTSVPVLAPVLAPVSSAQFYPSPPQTNASIPPPPASAPAPLAAPASASAPGPTSPTPAEEPTLTAVPQDVLAAPTHILVPVPTTGTAANTGLDDPFNGVDLSYLGGMNMDMDLDFDMGFGIGMDFGMDMGMGMNSSIGGDRRASGGTRGTSSGGDAFRDCGMDFDDAAFTDDDFSFFDQPSGTSAAQLIPSTSRAVISPIPAPLHHSSMLPALQPSSEQLPFSPPLNFTHILPPSAGPLQPKHDPRPPETPPLPSMSTATLSLPHGQHTPAPTPRRSPRAFTPRVPSNISDHLTLPTPHTNTEITPTPSHRPPPSPGAPAGVVLDSLNSHANADGEGGGTHVFDPIPFAAYHREMDGKYASSTGKFSRSRFAFSLPSPPAEEGTHAGRADESGRGEQRKLVLLKPSYFPPSWRGGNAGAGAQVDGWKATYYDAATDPRVGVVKKLIGVKRKMVWQGGRGECTHQSGILSPPWAMEYEEWESQKRPSNDDDALETDPEPDSDTESDLESSASTASPTPLASRTSTPAPTYLPLGPTLLHMHFTHRALLPLSTPLKPPGAAVGGGLAGATGPAVSVPTPVSPAAGLGASAERRRALEAAARAVATEVVRNALWAETWGVSSGAHSFDVSGGKNVGQPGQPRHGGVAAEVWLADVKVIAQLLGGIAGVQAPLELGALFQFSDSSESPTGKSATPTQKAVVRIPSQASGTHSRKEVQLLAAPMIAVAKGDAIIHILPPAVRFWEKLGLGPKGGRKDGTSFVVFEDGGDSRLQLAENWLEMVAAAYESRHFGVLTPGESNACARKGLMPLRFDSTIRKTLAAFLSNPLPLHSNLIIFLITPLSIMSLASPILRQVFSVINKVLKNPTSAPMYFQLVPEHAIYGSLGNPNTFFADLNALCTSLYNRIMTPVSRSMSRPLLPLHVTENEHETEQNIRKYFQDPLLTLARPLHTKVSFVRAARASLGVLDRNTFLHVGYRVSPCGKWLLAACVDERGEAHELGVWLVQAHCQSPDKVEEDGNCSSSSNGGDSEMEDICAFVVLTVWQFVAEFARNTDIQWRVVVAKLGRLDERELNAWSEFLDTALVNQHGMARTQVTLLSVEPDAPWTFCSTNPPRPKSPSTKAPHTGRTSSLSKNQPQMIFTDITNTIYATPLYTHLEQSRPATLTNGGPLPYIPESSTLSSDALEPELGHAQRLPALFPLSTISLICVPASSPSPTAITMLHTHLLHVAQAHRRPSLLSPLPSAEELATLHTDIMHSFHNLAVLKGVQWQMKGANPLLPFHLAAVDAMERTLNWEGGYGVDSSSGDV